MKTSTNNHLAPAPAFLRADAAARYLGIATRTLREWQQRGIIAFHKPSNRVALFSVEDLHDAVARFRVSAVGEMSYG